MPATETPLLTLTEKAAEKVIELMATEPDGEVGVLRVAVRGGGCAGPEYALGFDREALEGDLVEAQHGVQVVVDPYSAPFLEGATIDFVSAGEQEGFAIENPNALQGCGCGSSYRDEQESGGSTGSGCGSGCSC